MAVVRGYILGLLGQRPAVRAWVGVLIGVHLLAPLWFMPDLGAWLMVVCFAMGFFGQLVLFRWFGFGRILGLAHAWWVPALIAIAYETAQRMPANSLEWWRVTALAIGWTCVLIDAVDVVRWFAGERGTTVTDPVDEAA